MFGQPTGVHIWSLLHIYHVGQNWLKPKWGISCSFIYFFLQNIFKIFLYELLLTIVLPSPQTQRLTLVSRARYKTWYFFNHRIGHFTPYMHLWKSYDFSVCTWEWNGCFYGYSHVNALLVKCISDINVTFQCQPNWPMSWFIINTPTSI